MATIKFVRVIRDCGHNKTLQDEGETRGLIYDFLVMIDDEHRATFKRYDIRIGCVLVTPDRDAICGPDPKTHQMWGGTLHEVCRRQDDFLATIHRLLDLNLIPTVAEIVASRDAKALKKQRQREADEEHERIATINAAGVELYEALKEIVDGLANTGSVPGQWMTKIRKDDVYRIAVAAIKKAEGRS